MAMGRAQLTRRDHRIGDLGLSEVPRTNSRQGHECVKTDRPVAGAACDAMGMQRVPVCEVFYEAGFFGSRWQMPPMQKHGV